MHQADRLKVADRRVQIAGGGATILLNERRKDEKEGAVPDEAAPSELVEFKPLY